jgi:RimJ/RimL family protein N-acetyltransferase
MQKQSQMDKLITTPHGSVTLRPAQESDAQAYRTLRLEALHNHPEAFGADYGVSLARPMEYWADRLRTLGSENTIIFATHNQDLIGMCGIYRGDSPKTQHSATLVSVYVQPAWRGLRIAEGLIAACLEWAQQQGITVVKLGVSSTNTAAIRRYHSCGFKIYGIEPQALYANGVMVDEFLMARSL